MDTHQADVLTLWREKFGTLSPRWRLPFDSNALELSPLTGPVVEAIALSAEQAKKIRSFTGITSSLTIDIRLFGQAFRFHLVGRKIDRLMWGGTGSPSINSEAVATDLARGLSFAETVLSEVNSLVVILSRNGQIQRFNRLAEEYAGLKEADVIGRNAWELFMSPDEGSASRQNIDGFFQTGEAYEVERVVKTVKGPRLFLFRNKFVRTGDREEETFLICSGIDITEARRAHERLAELATTDSLTGLRNRNYLMERLQTIISDPQNVDRLAILFIDLDNFKRINDSLGHRDGDQLLKMAALRLSNIVGDEHNLVRIGGDEFVIVIHGDAAHIQAEELAKRVTEDFELAYVLRANSYRMRASIGIAVHTDRGACEFDLLTQADLATYAAKDIGKGKDISASCVYTKELSERAERGLEFYQALQYGFLRKEFDLEYTECRRCDGLQSGIQASVRWNRADGSVMGGREFLSTVESTGFSIQLGEFQLFEACKQCAEWLDNGQEISHVTIEIPSAQLQDGDLAGCLAECLRVNDLKPGMLRLLAPPRLDQAPSHVLDKLSDLRATGVKIFATVSNEAPFPNVGVMPIDGLRIARDLVGRLPSDRVAKATIRGLVGVCMELGIDVLADGVDDGEQFAWLSELGNIEVTGKFASSAPAAKHRA
ncbi:Cyclic di-GMP phosphodiesterase PdeR [Paraburkholderia nemoris]|uniref:diguanylate cyclase domain-containing protein n=1 Tax=Paraburkholderia nemoris TaxID=2793076 RepID=UPI00190C9547|nr:MULTISPECIES: diguanylate cyclase [Paraburkholderia]MBK3787203.1 diguanylate cyclase [Paraburkholderia aspalathi]CAE6868496.1 Cyclic di-GMP phosphodiesterase PdeR [Paraburkholderia nemoris]